MVMLRNSLWDFVAGCEVLNHRSNVAYSDVLALKEPRLRALSAYSTPRWLVYPDEQKLRRNTGMLGSMNSQNRHTKLGAI